jgi:hypothetical protein
MQCTSAVLSNSVLNLKSFYAEIMKKVIHNWNKLRKEQALIDIVRIELVEIISTVMCTLGATRPVKSMQPWNIIQ